MNGQNNEMCQCTEDAINLIHDQAWKAINEPVKTIYKNLDKSRENIISFLKYLLLNKNNLVKFFVPNQKCCRYHYLTMVHNCSVFNTWMFGRLFYFLGHSSLNGIHKLVVTVQAEILEMLLIEHPSLAMELIQEYILCLEDITAALENETDFSEEFQLKRFVPSAVNIPGIDLSLEPVFINVSSASKSESLLSHLLELLGSVTTGFQPNHHTIYMSLLHSVFTLINLGPIRVKIKAFTFAAEVYKIKPYSEYLSDYEQKTFYNFMEAVSVKCHTYDLQETVVLKLATVLKDLMEEMAGRIHLYPLYEQEQIKIMLINIVLQGVSPVLTEHLSVTFNIIIKMTLGQTFNWTLNKDFISHLIQNLDHCKYGSSLIVCCIVKEFADHLKLSKDVKNIKLLQDISKIQFRNCFNDVNDTTTSKTQASDVSLTWHSLLSLLKTTLENIASHDNLTVETNALNALSKLRLVHTISNCAAEACDQIHSLQCTTLVMFYGERLLEMLQQLEKIFKLIRSCPKYIAVLILEVLLETVGSWLTMAEFPSAGEEVSREAIAFMSSPWLHKIGIDSLINSDHPIFCVQHHLQHFSSAKQLETCIKYLAPVSLPCTEQWRVNLFSQLLEDGGEVAVQILYSTPQLLKSLKHENADKSVTKLLKPAKNAPHLHTVLMDVYPKVICALSGSCAIIRNFKSSTLQLELLCKECDIQQDKYTQINLQPETLKFLSSLTHLILSSEPSVRQKAVLALPSLVHHLQNAFIDGLPPEKLMTIISDDDAVVRTSFSSSVLHLILGQPSDKQKKLLATFYTTVKRTALQSLEGKNKSLQESLIFTLKTIGCNIQLQTILLPSISILIVLVLHVNSLCGSVAKLCLNAVVKAHNISLRALYTRYKLQLCSITTFLGVQNQQKSKRNFISSVQVASKMFGFESVQLFIAKESKYLLPCLFSELPQLGEKIFTEILIQLSDQLDIEPKTLILQEFQYIYPYLIIQENENVTNYCLRFMEQLSGETVRNLVFSSFKVIHNLLILDFASNSEKVLDTLRYLSTLDPLYKGGSMNMSREQIADFLQPRFLGVLIHFDNSLTNDEISETEKLKALQSLPLLIQLMGCKYITLARFKVLASLRIALQLNYSNFPQLAISAWDAYVHCLETPALGALLSTIFISLLPLLQEFPQEVLKIFHYLVVERQDDLCQYFKELYFIPGYVPDLKDVYNTIHKHKEKCGEAKFLEELHERILYASHEIIDVRLEGLRSLKDFIKHNRQNINAAVVSKEKVDRNIIQLLTMLTDACHDHDGVVRLSAGDCLAELGAIDPGIMPPRERLQFTGSELKFPLDVEGDTFTVQAISELAKGFHKAKVTQNIDAFSFTIQELLKISKIGEGSTLWNKFTANVQDIMRPLLKSSYKSVLKRPEGFPCPIYGTKYGRSLHSWVCSWSFQMISFIHDKKCRKIFDACALILKRDLAMSLYFLPYILLNALIFCTTSERNTIFKELITLVENPLPFLDNNLQDDVQCRPLLVTPRRRPVAENAAHSEHIRICRVAFSLLDFLAHWLREWKSDRYKSGDPMENRNYKNVYTFLEAIPKLSISKGNFLCREYACALKYLEAHLKNHSNDLQSNLAFLEEIYVNLNDCDGVAATLAVQGNEPSLYQTMRAHEVMGRLQEALTCYEQTAQDFYIDSQHFRGIIKCYLRLDQPFIALKIIEGVNCRRPELEQDVYSEKSETLWRLGRYEDLDKFVSRPEVESSKMWGVQIGKAISLFRKSNGNDVANCLLESKKIVLDSLCETFYKHGAYRHAYSKIVDLHTLHEIETAAVSVSQLSKASLSVSIVSKLFSEWNARLDIVQKSFCVMEPILCLRRRLLALARDLVKDQSSELATLFYKEIGNCWLKSAKAARKGNRYQQAYTYILNAEKYKPESLLLEKVKLHWARNDHESAFHTLQCVVKDNFPEKQDNETPEMLNKRILRAKALLLYARYNDDMVKVDTEQSVKNYDRALTTYTTWEKGYVCLAQFYDRVLQAYSETEKDTKGGDVQLAIVNCYGTSLKFGCKYIYQSMPRMLTLWLDYGSSHSTMSRSHIAMSSKMTELIVKVTSALPPYMLMTALSQLVSRLCHQNNMVVKQLKNIISRVLIAYPHYVLWMLMAALKSIYAVRAKRCHEILHDEKITQADLVKLVSDYTLLTDLLIELTNKQVGDVTTTTVTEIVPHLNKVLKANNFSNIVVPTEKYLNFILPSDSLGEHNPFPKSGVFINHLKEKVTILSSMQKPRCITLVGTDGESYTMLCKPKDDLRKDFRLMEFNGIVNKYLKKDPDSRQRALLIRTYAVVPLNEECGIIEWVPDLVGLRPMLIGLYKQQGIPAPNRILKELLRCTVEEVVKKKLIFEKLLTIHPPILSEWFLQTFPDPSSWYHARTTYIRTCAVMSMVGYILGLGDRHGENVLFDCSSGAVVHVDFNCLFNKGENFDCPEVVPFRLTQNMVSAMGPLGVEGPFRRACEISLSLLRAKSDTLMCVLRPFVYDPIISWKNKNTLKRNEEMTNERAVQHLARIEERLKGFVRSVGKTYSFPLSVEGQVNKLILEATSIDNLSRMYIGWGAYL